MNGKTTIDLSTIAAPEVIESVEYQALFDEMLARLRALDTSFDALVESDPAYKILEVCAYFRMLDRQRVNQAARAVMLPYATGTDLDNLAALFNVARLTTNIVAADGTVAGTESESDSALRRRVLLSLAAISTAGAAGAYTFFALSVPGVRDVSIASPEPGEVVVAVLSSTGNGEASQALIDAVKAAINADDVRPLTDRVTVKTAEILPYTLKAAIYTYQGPDKAVVMDAVQASAAAYVKAQHALGHDITLSGLYAALHKDGVQRVDLETPTAAIAVDEDQAAFCESVEITWGGYDV